MKSNLKLCIADGLTEIARHFSSWHVSNLAVRAVTVTVTLAPEQGASPKMNRHEQNEQLPCQLQAAIHVA